MMTKTFTKFFVLIAVMSVVLSTSVQAMEAEAKAQVRGIVVDISPESIVIQQESKEGTEISQFELTINKETKFSADESEDIALGDAVEVEFAETAEGKIALAIQEIKAKSAALKAANTVLTADLDMAEK
ncbi:MAG: hypothetical protein KC900_06655 [Candidatus Omnitrophica bacterium]|nr:hypothetical protein [Candidatus Omnitrophota bacterium]